MQSFATSLSKVLGPRSKSRDGAYRDHFHEATRLVFCVYHGIGVSSVQRRQRTMCVRFDSDFIWSGKTHLLSYIEMILSGAVAVQINYGGENKEMVRAIVEAERVYNIADNSQRFLLDNLEQIVHSSCRKASMHLADPKIMEATASITRHFMRSESDLKGNSLDEVIDLTRMRLS